MKLRFGEIEEVLQVVHGIPADAESQFRSKLRNLFRVGLSLPSGRVGRRANFDPADLFKLGFAVELLQAGMLPERVVSTLSFHWTDAVDQIFATRAEWASGNPNLKLLVAEPHALTQTLYRFSRETPESLSSRLSAGARLIVINITGMVAAIVRAAEKVGLDMEAFNQSLDANQRIILEDGARVGPASGFIELGEGD